MTAKEMSRLNADLRPSITKMTIKGTLPSITPREKGLTDSTRGDLSPSLSSPSGSSHSRRRQPSEKKDNIDHLLKEIEKWRSKFTNSQRALEEARSELRFKTDTINALQVKLDTLENDFKKDLQAAKDKAGNHNKCKKEIESLKEALDMKENELVMQKSESEKLISSLGLKIDNIVKENEEKLGEQEESFAKEKEELIKEFDKKIADLKEEYDKQISAKDERLKMMKKQIAEALTGSSLERQQQIEELLKELKRVSDEAETVKAALRNLKMKGDCQKCFMYEKRCKELQEQLRSKENSFNELMKISAKMEKQISQQEELLVIWNKVKNEHKRTSR